MDRAIMGNYHEPGKPANLQVTIEDAIAADEVFSNPMGQCRTRKEFIQLMHIRKNLDI